MPPQEAILLVATMDTKGMEALFLKAALEEVGMRVLILDPGIRGQSPASVAVSRDQVAHAAGRSLEEVQGLGHEGDALDVMTRGAVHCARKLFLGGQIGGVVGLGGSMGTTLGTAVMRAFPVGFPKVMITTMASRDTRPFVGTKDIAMLHSVCDISGLNRITRPILRNGAMAVAGMVRHRREDDRSAEPCVFLSTLGTTEACAQRIREGLVQEGKEVVIFHTVGSGGKAMEEMIGEGGAVSLIDLSLHEMADHLFGGDYDAGPGRGAAALKRGMPTVLIPGNIDFLVTGPLNAAQERFPNRALHQHNAAITTVRTSRDEMASLARVLAEQCNRARGPYAILVPMKGFSAFDAEKGPLYDPEGPEIFTRSLERGLNNRSSLQTLPYHVNDPEFADIVLDATKRLIESES